MKYVSLFAGIGGFDLALNRLGHECVYANDFDKYCKITYDKNFSHKLNTEAQNDNVGNESDSTRGDGKGRRAYAYDYASRGLDTTSITEVPTADIPDHDLLVGGFPCQAFSIAGKRRGFAETRGTLFFEIARILKDKKPKYFILENVKGLLSHDNGNTFKTIISTLVELRYDLQWQVLNSKNFGVPQNRERIFIVGNLRGQPRPKVFPITDNNSENIVLPTVTTRVTADSNGTYVSKRQTQEIMNPLHNKTPYGWHFEQNVYDDKGILRSLKAGGGSGNMPKIIQVNQPRHSNDRVYGEEGISPTLNTMQGGRRQPKVAIPVLTPDRVKKRQNGRRFKTNGEPSFTLTGQDKHGIYDGMKIRRLTPLECERLQGFPDNWTEGVSDTQRYKQLGNAVTVNVVYEVAKRLSNFDPLTK